MSTGVSAVDSLFSGRGSGVSLATGSGIGQGAAGPLGHGSPQQNLAVVPGGQGSQGQGTRPGLPGAPIVQRVCAVREGWGQGVGEGHVLGIGGAQIG